MSKTPPTPPTPDFLKSKRKSKQSLVIEKQKLDEIALDEFKEELTEDILNIILNKYKIRYEKGYGQIDNKQDIIDKKNFDLMLRERLNKICDVLDSI